MGVIKLYADNRDCFWKFGIHSRNSPDLLNPPVGDAFAARNAYALDIDFEEQPPMFQISDSHYAATWLLDERAPEITPPLAILKRWEKWNSKKEKQ